MSVGSPAQRSARVILSNKITKYKTPVLCLLLCPTDGLDDKILSHIFRSTTHLSLETEKFNFPGTH